MSQAKKGYCCIWGILMGVFFFAALLIPSEVGEWSKKDSAFWAAVIMMMLVMLGNLLCSLQLFQKASKEQMFLRLPIFYVSYVALLVTFVLETVCVVIPSAQNWAGFLLGFIILIFYSLGVGKAIGAARLIEKCEEKTQKKIAFMKTLQTEAELLYRQAGEEEKEVAKKVFEAIRYSDPCSDARLDEVEAKLYVSYQKFQASVKEKNEESDRFAQEFLELLKERNAKCKLVKR